LEKKIDTLKTSASKRKKCTTESQRSKSKIKQNNITNSSSVNNISLVNNNAKQILSQFQKTKENQFAAKDNNATAISSGNTGNKMLKKSYSDKNILKSRPPKHPHKVNHNEN
jgi:hypothetical protein